MKWLNKLFSKDKNGLQEQIEEIKRYGNSNLVLFLRREAPYNTMDDHNIHDMSDKEFESHLEQMDEQSEHYENLMDIVSFLCEVFELNFKHIKKERIRFEDNLAELTQGDIAQTSHAIMDLHQLLNVPLDYNPMDSYEKFSTIKDVVLFFFHNYDYRKNVESPEEVVND